MVRFIFLCMGIVALSMVAIALGLGGFGSAYKDVVARNTATTAPVSETQADAGPSFEEIYENATAAMEVSPEALNLIETAAGDNSADEFSGPFTDEAPAALQEAPLPLIPENEDPVGGADN